MNISGASFMLTENCNMRCSYCYENSNRDANKYMSLETAMLSVDFLINEAKSTDEKTFQIIFFGGEPLLNLDVLIGTFDYAILKSKEQNLTPKFTIATNASIYNKKYEDFLERYISNNGRIQLSIDGEPIVQDKHRIYINGDGSSQDVENVVGKYKSFFEKINVPMQSVLNIHSVISPQSVNNYADSYFYFRNLGFDGSWTLALQTNDWTASDLLIYKEQLSIVSEFILNECIKNNNLNAYIAQSSLSKITTEHPCSTCEVGKKFVGISSDGKIYPCHKFMFSNRDEILGDIVNGITNHEYREQFLNFSTKSLCGDKMCSSCDNTSCYRCVAINQDVTGDMLIGATEYCKMSRIENEVRQELFNKLFNLGLIKGNVSKKEAFMESNINDKELINRLVSILSNSDNHLESIDDFSKEIVRSLNVLDNKLNGMFDIISELTIHLSILSKALEEKEKGCEKDA